MGYVDGELIELAEDRIQRRALVLAISNLRFVLPQCWFMRSLHGVYKMNI